MAVLAYDCMIALYDKVQFNKTCLHRCVILYYISKQ